MSIPPFPPTPFTDLTYDFLEAELLVVIRHNGVTIGDLPKVYDRSFGALGQAISAGLFMPTGPALGVYHGDPAGTFDLDIGFPAISAPTSPLDSPAGPIRTSSLPAGRAAFLSHVGTFEGMAGTWKRLMDTVDGTPSGVWIEVYVSDPTTTSPDQLRTDLVLPLAG